MPKVLKCLGMREKSRLMSQCPDPQVRKKGVTTEERIGRLLKMCRGQISGALSPANSLDFSNRAFQKNGGTSAEVEMQA